MPLAKSPQKAHVLIGETDVRVTGLIRRFVASLMVLAVAAFVLHGTVHAGHLHGIAPTQSAAHASHTHSHDHGTSHVSHDHEHQADARHGDVGHHHGKGGSAAGEPCCGNLCTIGVPVLPGQAVGSGFGHMPLAAPHASGATGVDPDALKRPPRSLAIV